MTASEFAFLALGLVLGVASGAALIEVLRARPPAPRGVRVTVAPNAIHSRLASTLADPHGVTDPTVAARGGPGDRRWRDEIAATGEPAATGRRVEGKRTPEPARAQAASSGTSVRSPGAIPAPPATASTAPASRDTGATPGRPAPLWLGPSPAGRNAELVAVPMSMEPDPITTALRATAAASAVAAMSAVAAFVDRTATDADPRSGGGSGTGAGAGGAPGPLADRSAPDSIKVAAAGRSRSGRRASPDASAEGAATAAAPAATPSGDPAAVAAGPCAEERRVADERCAVATRAREGAVAAAEELRRAQRTYDELVARAEAAAATADPRAIRAAKEHAQHDFREARNRAGTRDDVEAGARAWLAEINRINQETRDANVGIERDRAAAMTLAPALERLAVEADAARISAERADEACLAARQSVADCDEARTLQDAARRSATTGDDPARPDPGVGIVEPGGRARIAPATPEPDDEFAFSTPMNSQSGQDALIVRILRGDREAMQRAVARLAGDDADARSRWQAHLGALAEALIARSIEATAFDFPVDHPFWGPFTQSQARDIAAGLSSLGFRFDGFGDWVDERLPSQRDLSLAVGYAGLDPMRVRRWPTEAETRDLLREVRVAADEYVAGAAGGLTLGELVTLLGRRADALTELWNQWGSVRPILLEVS